jgi:hypothetical protein
VLFAAANAAVAGNKLLSTSARSVFPVDMFFAFFACQMKSEIIIFVARMSKTIPGISDNNGGCRLR